MQMQVFSVETRDVSWPSRRATTSLTGLVDNEDHQQ